MEIPVRNHKREGKLVGAKKVSLFITIKEKTRQVFLRHPDISIP